MPLLDEILHEFATSFGATPPIIALSRLALAMLLGAIVGFEREIHSNAAGLRTHILISLASCLFALISFEIVHLSEAAGTGENTDPLRVIEAVTAGVAFLAAGSIIVSGGKVQGLTTGAGMWLAGAIGLCCGIGKYGLAAITTLLAVLVLWLLKRLVRQVVPDEKDSSG